MAGVFGASTFVLRACGSNLAIFTATNPRTYRPGGKWSSCECARMSEPWQARCGEALTRATGGDVPDCNAKCTNGPENESSADRGRSVRATCGKRVGLPTCLHATGFGTTQTRL